jgi:hypothetical protein
MRNLDLGGRRSSSGGLSRLPRVQHAVLVVQACRERDYHVAEHAALGLAHSCDAERDLCTHYVHLAQPEPVNRSDLAWARAEREVRIACGRVPIPQGGD